MARAGKKTKVPTGDEIAEIRRLIEKAGGENEFRSWVRIACGKRGRGRPAGATRYADYDELAHALAETLVILSKGKLTLNQVLETVVKNRADIPPHLPRGTSKDATIKRLRAKSLKDRREFDKLSKSKREREWAEFKDWLDSPGDADHKLRVAAILIALCDLAD